MYDFSNTQRRLPRDKEIPEGCAKDVLVELSHGKKEDT